MLIQDILLDKESHQNNVNSSLSFTDSVREQDYVPSSVIIGMSLPEMMLLLTFTGVPIGSKPGGTRPTGHTGEVHTSSEHSTVDTFT